MPTHQEYINEFKAFADAAIIDYGPAKQENNLISGVTEYLTDYKNKLVEMEQALTDRINEALTSADTANLESIQRLKTELLDLRDQYITDFSKEYG